MSTAIPAPGTGTRPVRWDRRSWAILVILSGNMVLDSIEVSVVLVALPSIGADLGLSLPTVQWLMSGFAVGFATLLPLGRRITAHRGARRAYLAAMLVFAAASVIGGLSDDIAILIATRVVKGFCVALTAPTGLAIIGTTFAGGPQHRRAVSIYGLFGAAGFTVGLLLSAVLLEAGWHWTFLFPAPVALVLLLFGLRVLPPDPPRDVVPRTVAVRDGALVRSALGAATLNGTYQSLLLLVTFQIWDELGWRPWQTALALLPACVPLVLTVPFAGRMVARFGAARLIALGALAAFLAPVYYLWRPWVDAYPTTTLPALLLVEAGFVLSFAALNMQATAGVAVEGRARAVSLYQAAVQIGAVVVLPLVALLRTAFGSDRPALLLITVVGAAGLLVALTGIRHRRTLPIRRKVPM
ncbi:MFS transporter [Plantactinospora sp. CA-294935]|uniref:MFS transporter n=1 Tax=Plantactinospora sp. CA-294935 TaxID=3240012 RepID=UPI003D8E661B